MTNPCVRLVYPSGLSGVGSILIAARFFPCVNKNRANITRTPKDHHIIFYQEGQKVPDDHSDLDINVDRLRPHILRNYYDNHYINYYNNHFARKRSAE